jgi:hypothetical protein
MLTEKFICAEGFPLACTIINALLLVTLGLLVIDTSMALMGFVVQEETGEDPPTPTDAPSQTIQHDFPAGQRRSSRLKEQREKGKMAVKKL